MIPQELFRIFPSAGFSQNANVELWLCGDFHQPTQLSLKKRQLCHLALNIASFTSFYCNLSNLRSIKCLSLVDGPRDWSVSPKRLVDLGLKWFLHRKCWGETTMKVNDVDVFVTYSDILTRYSITANHIRIPGVSWCPCNWVSAQWSCQVLSESSCTNSAITMPGIATHHGPTIPFQPTKKIIKKTASYGWAIGSSSLELGPQPVPHDTSAHGSTQRLRSSDSTLHSTIHTWVCFRNVTALKWYLFPFYLLILCVLCTGLDIWNQLQCKSFRISTLAHHSWELRNLDLWGPLLNICLEESSGGHLNSKSSLSGRRITKLG